MRNLSKYLLVGVAAMMVACDDNDIDIFSSPVVDDASLSGATEATTVSALTFAWQPVDGVNQYGYSLADPEGKVQREGVVNEPTVTFTKLNASTTYTLTVEAFGANGVNTRRFTMSGTTGDIISLNAPVNFEIEQLSGKVTIKWSAIEHADHYGYTVVNAEAETVDEGTVDEPSLTISGLAVGDYTFTVYAYSDDEAYSQSGTATYLFARTREVKQSKEGTYESYWLGSWPCTLDICDDGSYVIRNFMQVEGYDLELAIGDDNAVQFVNAYSSTGLYRYVETGLIDDYYIAFYESPDYSYYYSDDEVGKYIMMCAYYATDAGDGGYDYFRWDVPTSDAIIGTVCRYPDEDWNDNKIPDCNATIELGDGFFYVRGFAGVEGYDLKVEYDADTNVTGLTSYKDGEVYESTTSGYVNAYTGLTDTWYALAFYVGNDYTYAYVSSDGTTGYALLSAYFYHVDGSSYWGAYYVEWDTTATAPTVKTYTGSVCQYTAGTGWGDNKVPDCNPTVEVYDDYVIVRSLAGVEGYDMKVGFSGEDVTSVTPIVDGEEDETVTSGYVTVFTGLDDWYCVMPYVASGYCYAYVAEDTGYLLLGSYYYDVDGASYWGCYYIEW